MSDALTKEEIAQMRERCEAVEACQCYECDQHSATGADYLPLALDTIDAQAQRVEALEAQRSHWKLHHDQEQDLKTMFMEERDALEAQRDQWRERAERAEAELDRQRMFATLAEQALQQCVVGCDAEAHYYELIEASGLHDEGNP